MISLMISNGVHVTYWRYCERQNRNKELVSRKISENDDDNTSIIIGIEISEQSILRNGRRQMF